MTSQQARTIKIGEKVIRESDEATLEVITISRMGSGNCVFQVWDQVGFRAFWIHSDKVRKQTAKDVMRWISTGETTNNATN